MDFREYIWFAVTRNGITRVVPRLSQQQLLMADRVVGARKNGSQKVLKDRNGSS